MSQQLLLTACEQAGMQSVWDGQRKFYPARDDVVVIGDSELIPIAEALATDFEAAFRHAHESFANDTDTECPNGAHNECWPSTREFRHILFKAGKHQGLTAANHRIASGTFVSLRKSSRTYRTRGSLHVVSTRILGSGYREVGDRAKPDYSRKRSLLSAKSVFNAPSGSFKKRRVT